MEEFNLNKEWTHLLYSNIREKRSGFFVCLFTINYDVNISLLFSFHPLYLYLFFPLAPDKLVLGTGQHKTCFWPEQRQQEWGGGFTAWVGEKDTFWGGRLCFEVTPKEK